MNSIFFNRIADKYLFWILLLLAIALRFALVDYSVFRNDSVRDALIAGNIVEGHRLLHGSATTWEGVYRGPIFYYYLSLFYRISPDPRVLVLSSIIPNILALFVCFYFCRKFFGPTVARFTTLMYGFSPLVIGLFNFILEVNLSPLLLCLSLLFLFMAVFNEKYWMIVPLGFCLGLLWDNSQYYLSTILVSILLLLPTIRSIKIEKIISAILFFFLALIPFFLMDHSSDHSISFGMIQAIKGGGMGFSGMVNLETYFHPFSLVSSLLVFALEKSLIFRHPVAFLLSLAQSLLFPIGVVAFLIFFVQAIKKRLSGKPIQNPREKMICTLACMFLAPVFMLMLVSHDPQIRYYYSQYPINFLMISLAMLIPFYGKKAILNPEQVFINHPKLKAMLWSLLVLLCLSQAWLALDAANSKGLFNVRLKDRTKAAKCILAKDTGSDLSDRIWFNKDQHDAEGLFYGYEYEISRLQKKTEMANSTSNQFAVIANEKHVEKDKSMLCRVNSKVAVYSFSDSETLFAWMKKRGYIPLSMTELMANNEKLVGPYFNDEK